MKYFKIWGTVIGIVILSLFVKIDSWAVQEDFAIVEELPEEADKEDYIALTAEDATYEIEAGDTLWAVAEEFLGDGLKYTEIYHENRDVISDADYILPGQTLRIPRYCYIPKDKYDRGGLFFKDAMRIASPDVVDTSYLLGTDMEGFVRASELTVFSGPVTNCMGENALTKDWEAFKAEVIRCSEEICDGRVSDLQFEKYGVENGCDLCGYTFVFDAGSRELQFAVFYRLGVQNMAEVIGICVKDNASELIDVTRYIAASFEDYGGQIGMGFTKLTDNVGAYQWNYPELHNVFVSAMGDYYEGQYAKKPEPNPVKEQEIAWKEPAFEKAVRNTLISLWHLTGEEKEAFQNRAITANDVSVITRIRCHRGYEDAESVYLECNGHVEKFVPENGEDFSFADMAQFQEAERLELSVKDLTDYSFVTGMSHLKELVIQANTPVDSIDFLSELGELRTLNLSTKDYEYGEKPVAFKNITDLSVLANCGELRYLIMETPYVTDFSFLKNCPEICTFIITGAPKTDESVIPDLELLPKARFIKMYDESLRWNP